MIFCKDKELKIVVSNGMEAAQELRFIIMSLRAEMPESAIKRAVKAGFKCYNEFEQEIKAGTFNAKIEVAE